MQNSREHQGSWQETDDILRLDKCGEFHEGLLIKAWPGYEKPKNGGVLGSAVLGAP